MKAEKLPLGCPCGSELHYCADPEGIIHGLPYCAEFEKMPVDHYLTYVRRSHGISDAQAAADTGNPDFLETKA